MAVFITGGQAAKRVNFVEWLKSDGNQWVDTEFKPNNNTRVVMDVYIETPSSAPDALFGSRNGDTSASASFVLWVWNTTSLGVEYGSKRDTTLSITLPSRCSIDWNKNTVTVNGKTVTMTSSTFQSNYNAHIFGQRDSGGVDNRFVSAKLYSCQIYDNGTLVRDFRPCYDPDGIACLYDKVEKKYYYNQGSGEFIAGAAA